MTQSAANAPALGPGEPPLTAGVVAMINLEAQIGGLERKVAQGAPATVGDRVELIELIALRGQVLGRVVDYERADASAEQLMRDAPADAGVFVARARARARFHRFADALDDLEQALRLGADRLQVDLERASVLQAIGRYEPALAIYKDAATRRADFESLGALATLHAERGEIAAAEPLFDASRRQYRGVSPLPIAQLDFQRGQMWLARGDLPPARAWFEAAIRSLPAHAPAQGHLAEVEAELGEPEPAIARLLPLATSSDDPDYSGTLARILGEAGRAAEAGVWRRKAAARYDELVARRPEAFADHAAEFWLEAGGDPRRALELAGINLELRLTPRAHALFVRASCLAAGAPLAPRRRS